MRPRVASGWAQRLSWRASFALLCGFKFAVQGCRRAHTATHQPFLSDGLRRTVAGSACSLLGTRVTLESLPELFPRQVHALAPGPSAAGAPRAEQGSLSGGPALGPCGASAADAAVPTVPTRQLGGGEPRAPWPALPPHPCCRRVAWCLCSWGLHPGALPHCSDVPRVSCRQSIRVCPLGLPQRAPSRKLWKQQACVVSALRSGV